MPKLPNKSIKGANFKKWCIESIDAIIDYLSSARYLQGAPGVTIERKPSGIVIGLEKQAPQTASVSGGTAAYSGLTATVSGGTATVDVSGVNPLEIVAGSNVNITGGTNGELIVSATGGTGSVGFPDFLNGVTVSVGTNYPISSDSWLVGHVGLYAGSDNYPTHLSGYVDLKISNTATPSQNITIELYCNQGIYQTDSSGRNEWFPVCVPIKAGYTIRLTVSGSASLGLKLYPCI
jgi:hypothetical protein